MRTQFSPRGVEPYALTSAIAARDASADRLACEQVARLREQMLVREKAGQALVVVRIYKSAEAAAILPKAQEMFPGFEVTASKARRGETMIVIAEPSRR